MFECKRHYSYGDDGGDDENLVASLFSNLSKIAQTFPHML